MEDRYVGRLVDLPRLVECLPGFFVARGFMVTRRRGEKGYVIFATPSRSQKIVDVIKVFVQGGPDDFSVKFVSGSRSSAFKWFGYLTYFFGGSLLVSKGFESVEALAKIEKEFWVFVNEAADSLARVK